MSHTIAIVHHAGGVGKTTTTLNLGYALAATGRRVLLVDLDPQSDLSDRLGLEPPAADLAAALVDGTALAALPTAHGFAVVPSDPLRMAGLELRLNGVQRRDERLARALRPLAPAYDYVLIDCPPTLSLLTVNALYAADAVLVPVQAQPKAYRVLKPLWDTLGEVQSNRDGDHPRLLGLLLTMTDSTNASTTVEALTRTTFGGAVFGTTIPRRTSATQDSAYGGPLGWYAPKNEAALAYAALAQEVLRRAEA